MAFNTLGTRVHRISGIEDLRGDGGTESDMNSTLSGLKVKRSNSLQCLKIVVL